MELDMISHQTGSLYNFKQHFKLANPHLTLSPKHYINVCMQIYFSNITSRIVKYCNTAMHLCIGYKNNYFAIFWHLISVWSCKYSWFWLFRWTNAKSHSLRHKQWPSMYFRLNKKFLKHKLQKITHWKRFLSILILTTINYAF